MASPRRRRLDTLPRIRRTIAVLFHRAEAGDLETLDAVRLCSLLQAIARIIEGAELEQRVVSLEQRLADRSSRRAA